jgi:hypothetical protein
VDGGVRAAAVEAVEAVEAVGVCMYVAKAVPSVSSVQPRPSSDGRRRGVMIGPSLLLARGAPGWTF